MLNLYCFIIAMLIKMINLFQIVKLKYQMIFAKYVLIKVNNNLY